MIPRRIAAVVLLLGSVLSAAMQAHAVVGRTAGQGSVSPSGEATYTIPIRVPPGVNGLTPELALSYSHRNTEGDVGIGWGISGLSAISRCAVTMAQNGGSNGVGLTASDEVCVDGNQLRLTSGTQGTAGSQYRSEIDDVTRYTAFGVAGNGPQYFKAEAKNGLTYYYGNTTNSRIESLATGFTTTVLVWNLSKIADRSGNEILFTWQEDGAPDGEYRIGSIQYGGNPGQGVSARYTITFLYGGIPASDVELRYAAGGKLDENKRLSEIKVWYSEPATDELFRSYKLNYETATLTTGNGRLQSVEECAGNTSNCLAPTVFTYQDGANDLGAEQSSGTTLGGHSLPIDINGDGHVDLVYASGGYWWYRLAAVGGTYLDPFNSGIIDTNSAEAIAIDYNSDGLEDILVPSGGIWTAILGSASFPYLLSPITTSAADLSTAGNAAALDLNGDGKDDLVWGENVGLNNSKIRARYRDATGFSSTVLSLFTSTSTWALVGPTLFSSIYKQGRNNFFDVNGDGLADIAFVAFHSVIGPGGEPSETYYTDVYLGGFKGIFSVVTGPSTLGLTDGLAIDMNGDGYTDVAYVLGNGAFRFRPSNGKSFASQVSGPSLAGLDFNRAVAMDWNGDGLQDLLIPDVETAGTGELWKYLKSTGDGFANPVPTTVSANNVIGPRRIDKNGDGMDDLAYVVSGTYASKNHAGPFPDLLKTATDSNGNSVTFNYTSISQGSYTKGSGAGFPAQDFTGPLQVVQSEVRTTGIESNTHTLTYSYSGALMNVHGRGLGGFASREITDSLTGIKVTEQYEREFPFRGRLKSMLTAQPNGKKIHELTYAWSSVPGGGGFEVYQQPYAIQIAERQYEVGGSYDEALLSEKTINVTVDEYGTPTVIETITTEPSSANGLQSNATYTEKIEHSLLISSISNWCLSKPQTTKWINNYSLAGGDLITRTVNRTWDTGLPCRLTTEITEPAAVSDYKVTRAYLYDGFGNINSDSTTGVNMPVRTTTINWGTKGHFPLTVTNAENELTTHAWNYRFGARSSVTDPNGEAVSMLYDDFGRLSRVTQSDGTYNEYTLADCIAGSYCSTNYPRVKSKVRITAKGSNNAIIRYDDYFLDKLDRQVQSERQLLDGPLSRTRTIYDDQGRIAQQSAPENLFADPRFYASTQYDLIGRPISVSRPIDEETSAQQSTLYSYLGLKTVVTDAMNKTATKYFDVKGRVIRSQDHAGNYQNFEFDAFGSLTEVKDNNANMLFWAEYAYGVGPMRTQSFDMDMGIWTYVPNALGEVASYTDANNKTFTATFDKLSRPKTRIDPANAYTSSTTTTWTWGTSAANNNIGKIVSVIQTGGHQESFAYDSLGRLSQRTTTADGTHLTNYSYNATTGLLETYTFPTSTSGVRVKLKYEYSYGFTKRISDFANPGTKFWEATTMDAGGRIIDEKLENELQSVRPYDAVTGLVKYIQTGPLAIKQNQVYLWNTVGSLTSRSDTDATRTLTEEFFYDNLDRLDYSELDAGQGPVQNLNVDYDAAGLGNIVRKTDVCSGNWSYDLVKKHQLVSACGNTFQYDDNGNQIRRNTDDVEWYSYNYPSKIENGTRYHQYFYDGGRNRWKQVYHNGTASETTLYVGSDFEKRSEGSYSQFRHYIKADGRLVAMVVRATDGVTPTAANLSVLTDHLGSVVGMLDHGGNPAISESFAAYGERRDPSDWQGPIGNEAAIAAQTQRGFTGQTHLDASRLIHFGGRVLDAQFGRFLSADPNVPDPGSTQSFNRYSYLENDPLSGTDPSGFFGIDLGGFADNFNVSVSWRFGRRYTYQAPQNGCIVANAIGCYATAPVKAVLDVIVDKVIGPLPSYGWDDSLILYFRDPNENANIDSDAPSHPELEKALIYLFKSKTFRELYKQAMAANVQIRVDLDPGVLGTRFDEDSNTIIWDPYAANDIDAGVSSPAVMLAHEFAHAVRYNSDRDGYSADSVSPLRRFEIGPNGENVWRYGHDREDIRATKVENIISGEVGEPIRNGYGDRGVRRVTSSTFSCVEGEPGC